MNNNTQPTEADRALAHEAWSMAQLLPSEGIEDAAERIAQLIANYRAEQAQELTDAILGEKDRCIVYESQLSDLQQQLVTLRAEKAERELVTAREDSARLDWLEKHASCESGNCDRNSEGTYRMCVKDGTDYYKCTKQLPLRAAIDAAKSKGV